jgi:TetR/AcrR family transcriptional regulator, fatty acid metabolism regulator protein
MAIAIRAAIDAIARQLAADPNLDFDNYAKEVANVFDLATRAET